MLVTLHYKREFLSGLFKGLTIEQSLPRCDSEFAEELVRKGEWVGKVIPRGTARDFDFRIES